MGNHAGGNRGNGSIDNNDGAKILSKRELVMDVECYPNYFLVQFKSRDTRTVRYFEARGEQAKLSEDDCRMIRGIFRQYRVITFNGLDYDMPMVAMSLAGSTCAILKKASDHIIVGELRGWQFEQEYDVRLPECDHIDLREPVPGVQIGLKLYGGRLHSKKLQDLPYPPDQPLTPQQMDEVREYCENDLDTTLDLYAKARDPKDDIIGTRELLTAEFGIDVRSKSDAQIAEAIIRARVEKLSGKRIFKSDVRAGTRYKYRPPAFIQFRSQLLRDKLAEIMAADFIVQGDGKIAMPPCLEGATLAIGKSVYSMGIGGLHSTEKRQAVVGSDSVIIRDRDVVSYYPSLILQCGLFPPNMGHYFQHVYKDFRDRRVEAKRLDHKSTAQTLKIFLNGTFGKLGSRWSVLYAPDLLIQVTVTGQLALLMMIERMEQAGIPVVSANTDGIVMACPTHLEHAMNMIVAQWERETGFETDETKYRALYSRDVNNYLALKEGGGYKTKGTLTDPGVMKNPQNTIVNEAVCALMDKGAPIAETILRCKDVRKFLTVKRVSGGAVYPRGTTIVDDWVEVAPGAWLRKAWLDDGVEKTVVKRKSRPHPVEVYVGDQYLGKVVRWYRSTRSQVPILYGPGKKQGNKVGGSDCAMPLMELPDDFAVPADLDYGFYINEAHDLLREIGAMQ